MDWDGFGSALRQVVQTYGADVYDNPRQLHALLADLAPQMSNQTLLLDNALSWGSLRGLLTSLRAEGDYDAATTTAITQLTSRYAIAAEAARGLTSAVIVSFDQTPPAPSKPEAPELEDRMPPASPAPAPVVPLAPPPLPVQAVPSMTPSTPQPQARRTHSAWTVAVATLAVVVILISAGIIYARSQTGSSTPAPVIPLPDNEGSVSGVPVRNATNDYSWDELSALAVAIAHANSDETGLQIAAEYHLTDANGKLDGSQTKTFELAQATNGSQSVTCTAQIIGFRQDERADGQGKAGISFLLVECVELRPMNAAQTNDGGWEHSDLRQWLTEQKGRLPSDLSSRVVPVRKPTNNVGRTSDTASITTTEDTLWLPSLSELLGSVTRDEWSQANKGDAEEYDNASRTFTVMGSEGSQYQLFSDLGITWFRGDGLLGKSFKGSNCTWWLRTPKPDATDVFESIYIDKSASSSTLSGSPAQDSEGVAFGFCL